MTLRLAVTILAVPACVLSACSDEKTSTATSAPSMSRAGAPNNPAIETTAAESSTARTRVEKTVPAEPETPLIGFTSPTGTIGCILDDTYVRCDVREHTWVLPPRPADCELDYGQGVSMAVGEPAELVCAGDTALMSGDPLPYGRAVTAGSVNCQSAETGVTCRDASTGHGFTVAREAYTIF